MFTVEHYFNFQS